MSVIDVTKMWSKTGGKFSSEKFDTVARDFDLTEGYQVLAEIGDTTPTILTATGIPRHGDRHPSGVDAFVRDIQVDQVSPIFWQVFVGYEGVTFDDTVDVEWTDATSTEPIDRDYNGRAIVTENGEPVEGLTTELPDPIVVIRRKFFLFNAYTAAQYRYATNSDTFLGWPPGTARLVGYSAKNQFKRNAPLEQWEVTARVQFRLPLAGATAAQAWYKRWRHEGLYVKKDGVIQRAVDEMGQEYSRPVLLKTDGTQETNPDNAVFNYTQIYGSLPYSGLGLL